jgi:hypothetical protein
MRRFSVCLAGAFFVVVLQMISWPYFRWLEPLIIPSWLAIAWLEHLDLITASDWRGDVSADGEALGFVATVVFWAVAVYVSSHVLSRAGRVFRRYATREHPASVEPESLEPSCRSAANSAVAPDANRCFTVLRESYLIARGSRR